MSPKITEQLRYLIPTETIFLLRIYDQYDNLLAVMPNTNANSALLRIINHVASEGGVIEWEQAQEGLRLLQTINDEEGDDAIKKSLEDCPEYQLLKDIEELNKLRLERVTCKIPDLAEKLTHRKGTATECEAFIELLNLGQVRAAEKIKGVWQPQTYTIEGILNYFTSHNNHRIGNNSWDKIPLKTANYTDEDFIASGVRYCPGSVVRTGAYIGPQTVIMNQAFINIGAYIEGEGVMIDGATRVASCAQIGKGVKFGAGSGIEGVLEPAGRLPSIIEDKVKVGAMCEVAGIVQEGAVIASGVIMASGKKIYDEEKNELVPPFKCVVGNKTFLLPIIPAYRLAVGGSLLSDNGKYSTDAIILKKGDLRDTSTLRHFEKQGILYT